MEQAHKAATKNPIMGILSLPYGTSGTIGSKLLFWFPCGFHPPI